MTARLPPDLNRLVVFARVAETESFTRAAASLGLPKSSVSRSVAALEQELGVRLLQRTTRKLRLTEVGETYLRGVQLALASLDEATAAAIDARGEPRGLVRVTAPVDMANQLLVCPLSQFQTAHPQIQVELALTSRRVDLVQEGFHLAVRAGALQDSSLVARRVGNSAMGMFASPAYVQVHGAPKRTEDILQHKCIVFRGPQGRMPWSFVGPDGHVHAIDVRGVLEVDEMAFVHAAVAQGMGIGLLPRYVLSTSTPLVHVLPQYCSVASPIHVVSPPLRYEPARVKVLRNFLVETLSQVAWEPG